MELDAFHGTPGWHRIHSVPMRRAFAIALLGIFSLQGVARAQGICADAGNHDAPAHETHGSPVPAHEHAGHQEAAPPATDDCASTDAPLECCEAITTCGIGDLVPSDPAGPVGIGAMTVVGTVTGAFDSREPAPEPPPPRA